MEDIIEEFGQRVKQIRNSKGLSQKELSERTGINRSYLSGIEQGKKNSTLKNVVKLAEGLEVDVSSFFRNSPVAIENIESNKETLNNILTKISPLYFNQISEEIGSNNKFEVQLEKYVESFVKKMLIQFINNNQIKNL